MRMKFDKHFPTDRLKPYIKYFVVSECAVEKEYKVFPSSALVIGFQYKGGLVKIQDSGDIKLKTEGVTGITDRYQVFKNSADIGTVLVYFTETGFAHFTAQPAHELFNLSLSLAEIFDKYEVAAVEERLAIARHDQHRVQIVEEFLLSQLKCIEIDQLIVEAVGLIQRSRGNIRIKELNERLYISQSPFEKRFRKTVGTTAKKFADIVRFNSILKQLGSTKTLTEICYENNYFDQAHFIKDFKQFTGTTPEKFNRFL
jgi:AraC-like DNA-binding protein